MTTVAYNHKDKEIAVDSRSTCNGMIVSDSKCKVITVGSATYIGAGDDDHVHELVGFLCGDVKADTIQNNFATVFWVDGGAVQKSAFNKDDGVWTQRLFCNEAIGSGYQFALSAMDFGESAEGAVKYAMTRDIYTGGKVNVIKVK